MHIEENLRAGMSWRGAAPGVNQLGGVEQTKEMVRERRGLPILEIVLWICVWRAHAGEERVSLLSHFHPGSGHWCTTAIFSVVYGVLLRRFPTQAGSDFQRGSQREGNRVNFTEPNFQHAEHFSKPRGLRMRRGTFTKRAARADADPRAEVSRISSR